MSVATAAAAAGGLEQEDDTGVAEVKVAMPFTLKKQLMTDWENVTQEPKRLVKLPRELTAADVMSQYMTSKADRSTAPQIARAQELIDGVRIYFDKVSMSDLLLYGCCFIAVVDGDDVDCCCCCCFLAAAGVDVVVAVDYAVAVVVDMMLCLLVVLMLMSAVAVDDVGRCGWFLSLW